ncbi:MAG TPA: MOSC domain-containing protein [Terriglobia bacterium]|nr:MOSC domain-containing protein [Terriglobia bacterium]
MKVISINVAMPRLVSVHGKQVETGIFKIPVPGPVVVSKLNLEGDGQADLSVHGGPDKAVYLYSWDNILHWKKALQRDDLGPGSFGENLTVEGLGENAVAIGDEFAIGTARFVVTQPRLPCFKLALALETPSITKTFLESGRTGCYLRVLQEGTIQAGDPIYPLPSGEPVRVTIAEFVELYRIKRATREQIRKILSLAALPEDWKNLLMGRTPLRFE